MKVLIFSTRDAADYEEAKKLAEEVDAEFINKLAVRSLELVVRHSVVEPTGIVVLDDDNEVRARIPRLISASELAEICTLV